MIDQKVMGQLGIFIALIIALGVIVYETVTKQSVDVFFSGMVTLILGKYLQQVASQQGADSTNTTVDTVTQGVVKGINGGAAAQIQATKDNTAALKGMTDVSKNT